MVVEKQMNTFAAEVTRQNKSHSDLYHVVQISVCLLKSIGVWLLADDEISRLRFILHKTIATLLLIFIVVPRRMIKAKWDILLDTTCPSLLTMAIFARYLLFLRHRDRRRFCIGRVIDDWRYTIIANREIILANAKVSRTFGIISVAFMFNCSILFYTLSILTRNLIDEDNVIIKMHPTYCELLVSDTQIVSGLITNTITTGVCGLAAVFVMDASGQLNILVKLMRDLIEVQCQEKREVNRKLAEMMEHQIRIRKLQLIIFYYFPMALISCHRNFSFIRLIEDILQQSCLIKILECTFIVCILGCFIIREWESSNSIAMCSYFMTLMSLMINMLLFCYTGEQLSIQVERVASTSCDLDWYRLPDKKAREIVLVIMMSNLSIKVIASKIMELSFKTYGDIIKTFLTYFNMLLNIAD